MLNFDKIRVTLILLLWMILAESQGHHIMSKRSTDSDNSCGSEFSIASEKYPWEATLLKKTGKMKSKYLCGGVLINTNTIVTAASCIQPKNSNVKINLENITVKLKLFGPGSRDNFPKSSELTSKEFGVSGILIHKEWDVNDKSFFAHDFAMLKLDDEIEQFKQFLHPVCLKHSKEISDIKSGTVSGFNGTNFDIIDDSYFNTESSFDNDENYETTTNIENATNSYENDGNDETSPVDGAENDSEDSEIIEEINELNQLHQLKWRESFIAGNNSTEICNAKIGSGFYVNFKGKIYLRGIVSSAGRGEEFDSSEKSYAIFTDVPEYFIPVDMEHSYSPEEKNYLFEFSEAKFLKREPTCRQNDADLECSLKFTTFFTRCKNDTNIWDQLKGRQLSSLNVTIDGKREFCTQYFTQITSLKKLVIVKETNTFSNVEIDVGRLSKILGNLKQLKEFQLENLGIKTMQPSLFADNQQLEKISFINNERDNLTKQFLDGSKMLKEFTFIHNPLKTLPKELFFANQNLEKIDISSNQLTKIPESLLQNKKLLRSFNVQGNKLISIPELLFSKNVQLEMIDLSGNPIKSLPRRLLKNLKSLKVFNFEQRSYDESFYPDSTNFLEIPEKFFNDTAALEEINLSYCNIKELPVGLLNNLEKLKVVDFSQNKISSIPENFFSYNKKLESIFMVRNEIVKLPDNLLRNLPMLKLFDVRDNYITLITESFFQSNTQLEGIDMSNNPIEILPDLLFENLQMLKILYLESLPVNSISVDVFAKNRKLEYINLSGNENISSILDNLFKNNEELQELNIPSCEIENLTGNFIAGLKVLKKLNLSNNKISEIPENFFSNNELLEEVNFGYNQIKEIPKSLLNGLKSLTMFYLNGNLIDQIIPENYFTTNGEKADRIILTLSQTESIDPILVRSLLG